MDDLVKENALTNVARKCKAEMESVSTQDEWREIIDRHLAPLKLKFGITKSELQCKIYRLSQGRD